MAYLEYAFVPGPFRKGIVAGSQWVRTDREGFLRSVLSYCERQMADPNPLFGRYVVLAREGSLVAPGDAVCEEDRLLNRIIEVGPRAGVDVFKKDSRPAQSPVVQPVDRRVSVSEYSVV